MPFENTLSPSVHTPRLIAMGKSRQPSKPIMAMVAGLAAFAMAIPNQPRPSYSSYSHSSAWNLQQFTSLVVFGDSYSDDSRLGYFIANNGSAPPVGWVDPVVRAARQLSINLPPNSVIELRRS